VSWGTVRVNASPAALFTFDLPIVRLSGCNLTARSTAARINKVLGPRFAIVRKGKVIMAGPVRLAIYGE